MSDRRDDAVGRREYDETHAGAVDEASRLRQVVRFLRGVSVGALGAWAFIATIGLTALVILQLRSNDTIDQARHATVLANAAAGQASDAVKGAAAAQRRLRRAQIAACQRQNRRTAALNQNALATWKLDTLFAHALTLRPTRAETGAERKLTRDFHRLLVATTDTLTWTPLNGRCARAPGATQLPVRFSTRPPPRQALRITRGT